MKPGFPVVIEFTRPHGLEPDAVEGRDFVRYKLIGSPSNLPLDIPFKIIATNVQMVS